MNKKIFRLIAGITMSAMIVGQAPFADTIDDKKDELEQQKNEYSNVLEEKEKIISNIEKLDSKIEGLMREIDDNKAKEEALRQDIEKKEVEIEQKIIEINEEEEDFGKRLRAMYIANSSNTYLKILLEAESLSELLSRATVMKKVSDHNMEVIHSLQDSQKELETAKGELLDKKKEVEKILEENNNNLAKVEVQKSEQAVLVAELAVQEELYSTEIASLEGEIAVLQAKAEEEARRQQAAANENQNFGTHKGDFTGNDILEYAKNFLGVPYVWGGTTPNGFDCSGLTQYVYRHFGVYITRTTYTQMYDGQRISRDNLKVGDMVFFGSYNAPHHVGIYAGNNKYLHAPYTGTVVRIDNMTRGDFVYGVRPF